MIDLDLGEALQREKVTGRLLNKLGATVHLRSGARSGLRCPLCRRAGSARIDAAGSFVCDRCGKRLDVLGLIGKVKKLPKREAREWLAAFVEAETASDKKKERDEPPRRFGSWITKS